MDQTQDDMEIDLFDNAGWRSAPHTIVAKPAAIENPTTSTPVTTASSSSTPARGSARGKGRGRGSGRGGRVARLSNGTAHADSPNGLDTESAIPANVTPTATRGAPRGRSRTRSVGRASRGGRGGKRRRDSDEIKAEDSPSDAHPSDEEGEEEYTPQATATRSGRSVQKPPSFAPPPLPSPVAGVKRKRHMHRKNPELSVCRVCLRPHSPLGNMIVFCDGCNTPYHRYCHRPAIQQVVVDEPDREWYCAECERENEFQYDIALFKPSPNMTDEQKRSHLERVPQPVLIRLLIAASHNHPDIPLLPPDVHARANALASMPPPPQTNGHTSFSIPPSSAPPNGSSHLTRPPDDELETGYESDPPAHYPVPGRGLASTLPPEKSHLHFLVDDNRDVYTHLFQSHPQKANEGVYGPKISEEQRIADVARRAREEIEARVAVQMARVKREEAEKKRRLEEDIRRREAELDERLARERREREARAVEAERERLRLEEEDDGAREDLEMLDREISEGLEKAQGDEGRRGSEASMGDNIKVAP
ncbi:PHD-finger domain-containing protein 2 [Elsinoe fawcettii]|nr:PHD-finger domain-containing protein 2 [Elsinoe fawcettii]